MILAVKFDMIAIMGILIIFCRGRWVLKQSYEYFWPLQARRLSGERQGSRLMVVYTDAGRI